MSFRWFIIITPARVLTLCPIIFIRIRVSNFVYELVHVLVPELIRELQLVVQDLRMVYSKATVFAPHAHNFVDEIEFILRNDGAFILLHNNLRASFILVIVIV